MVTKTQATIEDLYNVPEDGKAEIVNCKINQEHIMLKIRKAKIGDADAIRSVHTVAVRGISSSHYSQEQIEAFAIPKPSEIYVDTIRNKEVYVAEEADRIVGFGILDQDSRVIEALFVLPDIRKGIGRLLLAQLEERARELGIERLSLNSSLNAEGFYRRSGYEAQKKATYRLHSGVEVPCIQMVKKI